MVAAVRLPPLLLLPLALPLALPALAQAAPHRISIHLRGPVALVQVERPLMFAPEAGRKASDEAVVDLDLPEGALLSGAELRGAGASRALVLAAASAADGPEAYRKTVRERGWRGAQVPIDEGVDLRLSVSAPALGEGERAAAFTLKYRFVAPLTCKDGRLSLRMPADLDPAPAPAALDLHIEPGPGSGSVRELTVAGAPVVIARSGAVSARLPAVSTRKPWEISFALGRPTRPAPIALAAWSRKGTEGALALAVCRPPTPASAPAAPPPDRVILLLDRSRSMGPGGAAAARDLARAVVEALPPSLRFNAVLFDRAVTPLFPVARAATLEALTALEESVGPTTLGNGTDLVGALRRAAELGKREAAGAPLRTLLVLITDGALPDAATADALESAIGGLSPETADVAVLLMRSEEDERASPAARAALAALPARLGGVMRELSPATALAAVRPLLADLQRGGDLFELQLGWPGQAARVPAALAGRAVAPGEGLYASWKSARTPAGAVTLSTRQAGARASIGGAAVAIEPAFARPLLEGAGAAWLSAGPAVAAVLARPLPPGPAPAVVRGQMDRQVVRNTLSLAFLPRARACYLNRPVKSARDRDLKGRLRLELQLERGEMIEATVASSTLARPDIEGCLREAAFAVEIPRAMHSDAPVVAALNLVFQPLTPEKKPNPSPVSEEIDLILGPMPPSEDPLQLLGP
jgi:hypothetical protein